MILKKIKRFDKKIQNEVQRAIDKIYKKRSKELMKLIAEQLPKGYKIVNGNGMCFIYDEKGEEVKYGRAWGQFKEEEDEQLNIISLLQYPNEFFGGFLLNMEIKSSQ